MYQKMDPEISLTLGASLLLAFASIYCCINTRRVQLLERRMQALEEKQAAPQQAQTQAQAVYYPPQQQTLPVTSYAYYQPQPTAPYFPQQGPVL